jgi:tape measure domain-containing protein
MKMLGDLARGDQEKLNALTLAFSQMTSTGKLTGQDLLQMINAGFNPLNEISKKTGKSVAVLKDEMSKGQISSEMVRDAFVAATSAGGQFHGMVEQLSDSKSGKWATAMSQATGLLWKLYDVIEPLLIPVFAVLLGVIKLVGWALDGVRFIVSAFVKAIVWWKDKLLEGQPAIMILTGLIAAFGLALLAVKVPMVAMAVWAGIIAAAKAVWAGVQAVLNAVMYACPLVWIITLIIALIAVIAYVCYKTEGWGSLWDGVVGFMKHTFLAYIETIKLAWTTMINGIMIGLDKIKLGWYKFKEAVGMGDSAENQAAIARINQDIEARKDAIVEGARKVAQHAQAAKDSLSSIHMTWNKEKTLGSLIGGMKESMGIGTPGVPGMDGGNGGTGDGSGDGSGNGGAGNKAVESIAGGGTRSTTININLGNLIENIFYQGGFGENKDDFERDIQSALIRVLQMANTAQ